MLFGSFAPSSSGHSGDGKSNVDDMTQDDRWLKKYDEAMEFLENNHRNPSRHRLEEHDVLNWIKHNRKVMNKGEIKEERVEKFKVLLGKIEENRRVNQWQGSLSINE